MYCWQCFWLFLSLYWPTEYWKDATACLQHKPPQTGCHKTVQATWQILIENWERHRLFSSKFQRMARFETKKTLICTVLQLTDIIHMTHDVYDSTILWSSSMLKMFLPITHCSWSSPNVRASLNFCRSLFLVLIGLVLACYLAWLHTLCILYHVS